ncbi:MAG: redoxin domain-containing protein [Isosphaeraceae bacterium]
MHVRGGMFLVALILPLIAGSGWADETPGSRLKAIEAKQAAARERFNRELQQLQKEGAPQQATVDRFLKELGKNVEDALTLASTHPEDSSAFDALKFVIRTNRAGPGDATARALRMMLDRGDDRRAGQGDYLATVALTLFQYPDAEVLLRRVLDHNPNRDERAAACYWLARHLAQQARMVRRLRNRPEEQKNYERYPAAAPIGQLVREKDPEALEKASETLLERIVREFADVRLAGGDRALGATVNGELFALRNLTIGKTAPEIDGRDHEGRTFRLSETRGKVVVLTFCGNWCGPCVAMYPQERALLEKHRDRLFTIVSVDTDDNIETLRQSIASKQITWRCWWDGGVDGPITTRWGIVGFPTIFVLDRRGLIRYKDVRGADLDRAVASLLDERESAAVPPR